LYAGTPKDFLRAFPTIGSLDKAFAASY